ncbi:MAG: C4-type zinc ribbon domain-containing protein [Polyangiaceae bacterium]|nr:C4-type zinc ribbon domain-containing protein [Polyangiaceae bacterium]
MSIPDQIRALEKLAQIDAELKEIQDALSQERSTLDGLKSGIAKLEDKVAGDRAALAAMDKSRGELIQDVRNMTQQLDHSREKLSRSRTEREANAAQRELEELRKLVRDREDEIGKVAADADAARQQIDATEADHRKLREELSAREGDISSNVGEAETKARAKSAEREAAVKALPPALYRRYDMIRSKRGTAIAQTTDGTCKACHMSLPPQLFHRLRREPTLEQCPSCNRIIYFAPAVPATAPVAPERG